MYGKQRRRDWGLIWVNCVQQSKLEKHVRAFVVVLKRKFEKFLKRDLIQVSRKQRKQGNGGEWHATVKANISVIYGLIWTIFGSKWIHFLRGDDSDDLGMFFSSFSSGLKVP